MAARITRQLALRPADDVIQGDQMLGNTWELLLFFLQHSYSEMLLHLHIITPIMNHFLTSQAIFFL